MPPDHSTISRTRRRIAVETHEAVFGWVLGRLAEAGLLKGKTLGVDATTLEANAALRSIVLRDTGEGYQEFLVGLAQESGIHTPTREQLARLDRKRKKKGSNQDWVNPHDPDARITKMKDGRTHLAHKAEHAVDLETGAVVAVTLTAADEGDTATLDETLCEAGMAVAEQVGREAELRPDDKPKVNCKGIEETVTDKGYHSSAVVRRMKAYGVRSYIPEKKQKGRRHWQGKPAEQQAVYANRRRVRGEYGKSLLRRRGELVERSFAHCYETGGMRRCHLRVEMWRGGLGGLYLFPALSSAGASLASPCSVSTSRSSNRTGGFPASGSRRRLTLSPTESCASVCSERTRPKTP
jgi:transposase